MKIEYVFTASEIKAANMKKIINGKKYDTETANAVGAYANSGRWCDFTHYEETLYQKRTGEYFLHGEGGPMTKYAVAESQNCWTGGEKPGTISDRG